MAYETKLIMALLAERVAKAETVEEAYSVISNAASVEGLKLPTYEDAKEKFKEKK
ncbi:MAG: hypothetical protein FWD03_08340 [Defluviitaleaceae bacterium]|nr:hypothetical protein [Defluviitaleaceae bacterium]